MFSYKDERVKQWLFMDTPTVTCGILVAYILSIVVIKWVMAKREAYELKSFLILYNFLQVIASFYIFAEVIPLFFFIINIIKYCPQFVETGLTTNEMNFNLLLLHKTTYQMFGQ